MSNHLHLVIETPQPNVVAGMKWLLGTYTIRFNRRHQEFGHLFSGRYKALIVDGSGNGYLKTVCDYQASLAEFAWSSYPLYLKKPGARPRWLRVDWLLGEWRIPQDSPAGRKVFAARMEERRFEEVREKSKPVERGWCMGDEQFRRELLERATKQPMTAQHYGEAVKETVAGGHQDSAKWL